MVSSFNWVRVSRVSLVWVELKGRGVSRMMMLNLDMVGMR